MKNTVKYALLGSLFVLLFWNCARRGAPTGGEKDVDPPVLLKANPENGAIHFDKKKIKLSFDEYVVIKDLRKQLVISPPLKYEPIVSPQGLASKTIEIRLRDTLLPNTTYSMSFGQSIVDNNEGNAMPNFKYVFSTGSYIDSLELSGFLKDAYKVEVDAYVSVMLYEKDSIFNDSTIYKMPPRYITNTLDSLTSFQFKNLKAGTYRLIAIKDENTDNKFDPRGDKLAFLDQDVQIPNDTIYQLDLFKEALPYAAKRPQMVAKNRIVFGFEGDYKDVAISIVEKLPDSIQRRYLKDPEKDSIHLWMHPTAKDSLRFVIENKPYQAIDTFQLRFPKIKVIDSMQLTLLPNMSLDLLDTLRLRSNTPIQKIDSTKIFMVQQDSIALPFEIQHDLEGNELLFLFEQKPERNYGLQLLPGAVGDMFATQNDTLTFNMSTKSLAEYGSLNLELKHLDRFPVLVQVLDKDYKLIRSEVLLEARSHVLFAYLKPQKYRIRLIFDDNGNGVWDTGDYMKKLQPERIIYLDKEIELRANWDYEEEFDLKTKGS
ncbi:MAG: Ig-like domain-containing protein [Flavobacteriaceae bacterium]|nr:Ig-like domain-containing protein [Flavobacteriaceae bacterium]